jgi:hypothetical protein
MTVRITKPKINLREKLAEQSGAEDTLRVLYDTTENVVIGQSIRYNTPVARTAKLLVQDSISHQYSDGNVSVNNCVLGLTNHAPQEQHNQHATLQFNLHGGAFNRVGGISFVGPLSGSQATDLAFWTDAGGVRKEKMRITGDGKVGIGINDPQYSLDQYTNVSQNAGEYKIVRSLHDEVVTGYNLGLPSGGYTSVVTVTVGIGWLRGVTFTADFTGSRSTSGPDCYMQRIVHALMSEGTSLRMASRINSLEYAVGPSSPVTVGTGDQAPRVDGENIIMTYLVNGTSSIGYDSRMLFTGKGPGITDISVDVTTTTNP